MAWQPEQGQLLAAPGLVGIVLYERLSWHACGTLGEGGCEIQTLCFSPDGESQSTRSTVKCAWIVGLRMLLRQTANTMGPSYLGFRILGVAWHAWETSRYGLRQLHAVQAGHGIMQRALTSTRKYETPVIWGRHA